MKSIFRWCSTLLDTIEYIVAIGSCLGVKKSKRNFVYISCLYVGDRLVVIANISIIIAESTHKIEKNGG